MKIHLVLFLLVLVSSCAETPIEPSINTPEPKYNRVENIKVEVKSNPIDERVIELNQNLAIYCMKESRSSRFKTELDCANFVKSTLRSCEKNHRIVNRELLTCVKRNLNLK